MKLVIQTGNQASRVYELTKEVVSIGRESNNDVIVPDGAMSRNHCQLRRQGNGYVVQDLGSRNGTFVNQERIAAARPLRVGDTIRIGQTSIRIEDNAPAAAPSVSQPTAVPPPAVAQSIPRPVAAQVPVQPSAPSSNSNMVFIIGGVVVGLIVVAMILSYVILGGPSSPTLTPTVTATAIVVVVPAATPVVPTATLAPSLTPGTATAKPPSEKPNTPTNTPTSTNTPTPTPTNTPTATPSKSYIPPIMEGLPSDNRFDKSTPILLTWRLVGGPLRESEYFRVQVALDSNFNQLACEVRTKDTYINLPMDEKAPPCNENWLYNNHYIFRVQVIALDSAGKVTVLSPDPGPSYDLYWAPRGAPKAPPYP